MEMDEGNIKLVPKFKQLVEELTPKLPQEKEATKARLQQEVDAELDRTMGEFTFDLAAELEKIDAGNAD